MTSAAETATDPFLSDAYREDAKRVASEWREIDPVHYVPEFDCWMVTRHDDVKHLLKDTCVTNDRRAYSRFVPAPEGSYIRHFTEHNFFSSPEDEHQRLRRLVSASLTPRGVKRMKGQIEDVVEQFASPLRGRRGIVDVAAEFTSVVPNTVISRITGIPAKENDEARFRQIARDTLTSINPFLDEEGRQIAEAAMLDLSTWVRTLADERRANPQEDMISDLLLANEEGGPTTAEEIVIVVTALITAGTETTAVAGLQAIKTLMEHPDIMARLRADRSLLPSAVRELLRFDAGFQALPRYAVEDFEIRGKKISKGQLVMLHLGGVHRDPTVFANPGEIDLERDTGDLIIFGHGPHYCIGANLAQLELACMLDAALDFIPEGARLVKEEMTTAHQGFSIRSENLPIDFG